MKPSLASPQVESTPASLAWTGEQILPSWPTLRDVDGGFVDFAGERCYRISQYDRLPPFLMTVVSASDHWLFVSSTGGLTAGRVQAERALFPYQSVDRIHDAAGSSGPFTVLLVARGNRAHLWEPFRPAGRLTYRLTRNLYKSIAGHRLFFEEINHDLGLTWSAEWTTSERFGFVRQVRLVSENFGDVSVRVVDGLRNLLPAGIPRRLADEMSCLTDAYKRAEIVPGTSLAIFALSAGITDQPIALESLQATVAWCEGLPEAGMLLTEAQLDGFRQGATPRAETDARGVRGVYAVFATLELEPGESRRWAIIADQGLCQSSVVGLAAITTRHDAGLLVRADVEAGARRLHAIVGGADGLQAGGDEAATAHHFANVLFNVMRGGAFLRGNEIPVVDFARFVDERNHACSARHARWLAELPPALSCSDLRRLVQERGDAELERLFLEYLPLGFSRRHGDPSRPWNRFSIRLRDSSGAEAFEYEGNWRDIFQNWEALGTAFPEFLEHMVAKFVNASTVDGHNPYRVTRRGVEWEVPAPDDPWAGIGYWGDHQIVYLLKLLEWAENFAPGRFHQWLERAVFSYAAVPYRIVGYEDMRRDPRATIRFLSDADAAIRAREATEGSDARLVHETNGRVRHVTLTEKLLLTALARLADFVPGGGIWMNTQRPEWNDANNALVGFGVSGVTLANLRRYLAFCRRLFVGLASREIVLSAAVARFADELLAALRAADGRESQTAADPAARRALVDALAGAGSRYRENVYAHGLGTRTTVPGARLIALVDAALPLVDASLRALRRPDGLYHAYRLLHFSDAGTLTLDDLPLMLEGQVAALGSGLLDHDEAVVLLRRLRACPLYRGDCRSYVLYPDGNPPGFLQRNVVPDDLVGRTPLLAELLSAGDCRLVVRDARGTARFRHDLVNAAALDARLKLLERESTWAEHVRRGADAVRDVFEKVFRHRAFTGRSGAMFAYEGLGSVYWHMVSKLLVTVQECHARAAAENHPAAVMLARAYFEIRSGLGFNKSPVEWGAFPMDPHSHTPGHAGAQQPGMTGQVKEGILARLGELGVVIADGRLGFAPRLLRACEFMTAARAFSYVDVAGRWCEIALPAGALAFTLCGTPVVYALTEQNDSSAIATLATGETRVVCGAVLSSEDSAAVFDRAGEIRRIQVSIPRVMLTTG